MIYIFELVYTKRQKTPDQTKRLQIKTNILLNNFEPEKGKVLDNSGIDSEFQFFYKKSLV